MLNTVKGPVLKRADVPLGTKTHGAVKSRSKWLALVKMREYSNGMKSINIHKTNGCFHKGERGKLISDNHQGKKGKY